MNEADLVLDIIAGDRWRLGTLNLVAELELPDAWVGGGFVRNAVWDRLHDRPMTPLNDIDVVYCDRTRTDASIDENLALELAARSPKRPWSVLNVARKGFKSVEAAMRKWPETATAVAVAIQPGNRLALLAPYGVTDLVAMIVRPTSPEMVELVKARMEKKRWLKLYPNLELALEEDAG
ncbi:MAG: nucleotidyltransferase family protein [Myxococcales bacterium]|nr:nucleotidyltransferase family protein [Myxococcales bacterium]